MTTPTKESHDPNRGPVSALKRRPPAGGELGPSPSKQRKKVKNDRRTRRVSFAPDPELTMVHHFEKDEFSAHSSDGRPVLSTLAESDSGAPSGDGGYRPGFWDKTVPDGSPLQEPASLDSPGMVSMEITQPLLAAVHQGFGSGEEEEEAVTMQQQQYAPGEVTAGLPSLGALAEADAYEDELLLQQAQLGGSGAGTAGEWQQGAGVDATMNITGGIPGLSSLIAEDEEAEAGGAPMDEATAGMDLTLADGRVLEHVQQPPVEPEQLESEPAAAPAAAGRRSSTGDLSKQRVVQANKWGFAPGCEDTLDLNLEMHGRMIMGDTTFNRMYGDTTGETTLRQHAAVAGAEEGVSPQLARGPEGEDVDDILLSPEPSKQQQQQGAAAAGRQAAGQAPNWQAPAFLPPYMQHNNQTATLDHPALVQSPADSNSTMETRRLSVAGDLRCLSDVKSRRMSMQDATGRLLQDDLDDDLGLDLAPASQPGLVVRRQSHVSAGGRGDITERLLADDDEEDLDDGTGPLAGIKRQMRMLSQEQQLEQPYEPALGQQQEQQKAAQTPQRPAHSMGVADSSNPVTMALLRSGGTTRLLQDTVHVRPRQQGQVAQAAAARPAATGGSNGTTKLLADMTMVSMVGAKRQSAGLLAQRRMSVENGLTDYSLDGFDVPPELPAEQHHQQAGQDAQQQLEQQRPSQHGGMAEAAPAQEQGQQHAATPPQPSASQGYPAELPEEVPAIPGGPKLTRTPVPVRPDVSQQRTQNTPRVHSTRSHPSQITPASRQQDATPPPSAATYPIPRDDTGLIPGGPKLARTPVSSRQQGQPGYGAPPGTGRPMRTPVTGQRLPPTAPGSAMAQHYPGTGPLPTSAMMVRYPGSAVAAHRLGARGMTPLHQSQSQPLPMTFQDFTKLMDVQFLDNLRRGASINYADMQPNPVPKTVQDAYTLLCSIAPQVNVLENGIRILQELVQERRIKSAESETFIGLHNPSMFGEVQFVDEERLEELKTSVGLLKKLQRQKAVAELKAYRKEMEEDKAHRLVRNLELLQHDREFLEGNEKSMVQLAHAGQQYVAEQQQRMEEELLARQEEAERRERLKCMQASLEEQQSSNAQRRQQLAEVQARVAALKASNAALSSEREAVQSKIEALSQRLSQSQSAATQQSSSAQELLDKSVAADMLSACTGLRLEHLRQDSNSAELVVRLAGLFQMRLQVGSGVATATVQLAAGALPQLPESSRQLVADMAASQGQFQVNLAGAGATNLTAAMQAASARLNSVAELAKELEGLKLGRPSLFGVSCCQGAIQLDFTNLTTEVQFSVVLSVPSSYPQGNMPHELKIRSDGEGHITPAAVAAALAAVPEGRCRIRAVCAALSSLASSAPPAQPFFLRPPSPSSPRATPGMTPRFNFSNPLYGGSASRSTVKQIN